jgi:hypothetical protein
MPRDTALMGSVKKSAVVSDRLITDNIDKLLAGWLLVLWFCQLVCLFLEMYAPNLQNFTIDFLERSHKCDRSGNSS